VELEGPGWYRDFLAACADAPLTDPASSHYAELPSGTLYNAGLEVCDQLEETVRDMRHPKNRHDRDLALGAGTFPADYGDEPWFLVFCRPLRVKGLDNKPMSPLVALSWAPPNELAFVGADGNVGFVQWPKGTTASEIVQLSNDHASLAPWFLVSLTWRSAWHQGAFDFETITDPEYMADWMPAGGYKVVLSTEGPVLPTTDGETQWIRR
jgi:hypothetical protein